MADKKSDPKDKKEAVTIGDKDEMSMGGDTAPKERKKGGKEAYKEEKSFVSRGWGLESDRLSVQSPLLESLRQMAGYYGRRTSIPSMMAGLPMPKTGGITPSLFLRAAERCDLDAKLADKTLEDLVHVPNLPCILVLEGGQSCILWRIMAPKGEDSQKWEKDRKRTIHPNSRFIIQFPETETDKKAVRLEKLKDMYAGQAFFIRPVARTDERAGPAATQHDRGWFFSRIWENKAIYREVILAAIMINLFALASPLFVMNVYDRVVPNNATDTLWVLAAGVSIAYLFDFLLKNLRAHFLDVAGRRADVKISSVIFEQIMGMKMKERPQSAGIMTSHMKDFEGIRDFFTSATMTTLIDLPFTLFFAVVIFVIGGYIGFVPLVAAPIVIIVGLFLQGPLTKVVRESMHESSLKSALLFETVTGLETIKVQAAEGHTQRKWEELTDKASRTSVKSRRISSLAMNWAGYVQQMTSVVVVIVGTYLITSGELTMGALIACVILTGRAMAPLAQVAGLMTRLSQSKQGLVQLDELMGKEVERPRNRHFVALPAVRGKIEFRDVVFHYPGQTVPALNHTSFTVEPGEHVGIIGAVGSGKTTVERLLLNLYEPTSGAVLLDGTDVRQIEPGDLRRNLGAVQQSPQLFFGSVRDNITMGHETAPDRAVIRAAELSGVTEFLKESQYGLDTQVGERGEALSGGQRQAVAIARSLLYDPPVLILDEPTASMDPASENRLRKRLHEITEGRTTILITHKGAMLSLVDKLILMDRGRVVAYGPKDEVIAKLQARQYGTKAEND